MFHDVRWGAKHQGRCLSGSGSGSGSGSAAFSTGPLHAGTRVLLASSGRRRAQTSVCPLRDRPTGRKHILVPRRRILERHEESAFPSRSFACSTRSIACSPRSIAVSRRAFPCALRFIGIDVGFVSFVDAIDSSFAAQLSPRVPCKWRVGGIRGPEGRETKDKARILNGGARVEIEAVETGTSTWAPRRRNRREEAVAEDSNASLATSCVPRRPEPPRGERRSNPPAPAPPLARRQHLRRLLTPRPPRAPRRARPAPAFEPHHLSRGARRPLRLARPRGDLPPPRDRRLDDSRAGRADVRVSSPPESPVGRHDAPRPRPRRPRLPPLRRPPPIRRLHHRSHRRSPHRRSSRPLRGSPRPAAAHPDRIEEPLPPSPRSPPPEPPRLTPAPATRPHPSARCPSPCAPLSCSDPWPFMRRSPSPSTSPLGGGVRGRHTRNTPVSWARRSVARRDRGRRRFVSSSRRTSLRSRSSSLPATEVIPFTS